MIKRIKITLLCLTALFFSLGFCFLSAQTAGVNNAFALEGQEMTLVSQNVIEQEYCIDQYFDVPEYSFTFNGQTQVATSVLYSPSKKAYDSNKIKLSCPFIRQLYIQKKRSNLASLDVYLWSIRESNSLPLDCQSSALAK